MTEPRDELHILAPVESKGKFDYLHRQVQRAAGMPITRRHALGLGGLAILAAACGTTTTTGGGSTPQPRREVKLQERVRQIRITSSAARRGDDAAADSGYPIRNAVTPCHPPELRPSTARANTGSSPADASRSARSKI